MGFSATTSGVRSSTSPALVLVAWGVLSGFNTSHITSTAACTHPIRLTNSQHKHINGPHDIQIGGMHRDLIHDSYVQRLLLFRKSACQHRYYIKSLAVIRRHGHSPLSPPRIGSGYTATGLQKHKPQSFKIELQKKFQHAIQHDCPAARSHLTDRQSKLPHRMANCQPGCSLTETARAH